MPASESLRICPSSTDTKGVGHVSRVSSLAKAETDRRVKLWFGWNKTMTALNAFVTSPKNEDIFLDEIFLRNDRPTVEGAIRQCLQSAKDKYNLIGDTSERQIQKTLTAVLRLIDDQNKAKAVTEGPITTYGTFSLRQKGTSKR
jgi:hypothetical protein